MIHVACGVNVHGCGREPTRPSRARFVGVGPSRGLAEYRDAVPVAGSLTVRLLGPGSSPNQARAPFPATRTDFATPLVRISDENGHIKKYIDGHTKFIHLSDMTVAIRREPAFVPSPSAEAVLAESAGDAAFATTLAKGLVVLEAFAADAAMLGNMELSARTGIPRPTVARLTHTLAELGYLRYDPDLAKYRLGARTLRIVRPLLAGMKFRQVARPLMQELAESVRGTVSIGLLDGTAAVYVESARSGDVGPHVPDIGLPIPVVMTAMGRALAALLPAAESALLEERIKTDNGELWTAYRDKYVAGLRQCADRGFCTCYGEYIAAIHAVAAPLFHARSLAQAFAINCGIPAFRLQPGQLEAEIGPRIKALAASIRSLVNEAEPAIEPREPAKKKAAK